MDKRQGAERSRIIEFLPEDPWRSSSTSDFPVTVRSDLSAVVKSFFASTYSSSGSDPEAPLPGILSTSSFRFGFEAPSGCLKLDMLQSPSLPQYLLGDAR